MLGKEMGLAKRLTIMLGKEMVSAINKDDWSTCKYDFRLCMEKEVGTKERKRV
jgi:hypothetical protein